jgi:DNA-binding GntR family transcriptional regulator
MERLNSSERGRSTPAYRRLAEDLRAAIREGRYANGKRLPTEAELERHYGVSRQTVRRAFQDLVAEGLVYRVPKRGTFVTDPPRDGRYVRSVGTIEDLEAWTGSEMELVKPMELKAEPEAAAVLALPSKVVAALTLKRLYEGVPFGVTRLYLSPELGQRLAESDALPERGPGTVIGTLEAFVDRPVAGVKQTITSVGMPEDVAALLEARPGEHSLRVERTYFDDRGAPVELAVTYYHPDRYSYRLELRRSYA